jgi:hypothetical protein
MPVTVDMVQEGGDKALLDLAADAGHPRSRAALWMLLLLRLTSVATDQRLELRNSRCPPSPSASYVGTLLIN